MIRKIAMLLGLCFLVVGCLGSPPTKFTRNTVPSYLVMVTSEGTNFWHQCAGIQTNAVTVITAAHCLPKDIKNQKVLTQYNQTVWFSEYTKLESLDLAIIKTSVPLYTEEYPTFGLPKPGLVETYGLCAGQFYFNARSATWMGTLESLPLYLRTLDDTLKSEGKLPLMYQFYSVFDTHSFENSVCLGDSGGVVVQDGTVVGMTEVIFPFLWMKKSQWFGTLNGDTLYTVLSETGNLAEVNRK